MPGNLGIFKKIEKDCKNNTTKTIAATLLDFLSDDVRSVEELPEDISYHLSGYRKFTDTTKLQTAQNNAKTKRKKSLEVVSTGEVSNARDGSQTKLQRNSRRMLGSANSEKYVICKKSGPIYVTNSVSLKYHSIPKFKINRFIKFSGSLYKKLFRLDFKETCKAKFINSANLPRTQALCCFYRDRWQLK